MARGMALCIGLNRVNPEHYQGWSGPLRACEFDANDMALIAQAQGFEASILLSAEATIKAVSQAIVEAAGKLVAGDIFLLTYSGHGGLARDLNGDENGGDDSTWCLYDRQLIDDQIYGLLGHFAEGVRVLVLSDSCHSGSLLKDEILLAALTEEVEPTYKAMPSEIAIRTYFANQDYYDPILADLELALAEDHVKAAVVLISGCQDNQLSKDGLFNGVFTAKLKKIWNGGKFSGSISEFHQFIKTGMKADQTPNLQEMGQGTKEFLKEVPFTV